MYIMIYSPFFFSSRRRHTRLTCDWSSDVCSSDLATRGRRAAADRAHVPIGLSGAVVNDSLRIDKKPGSVEEELAMDAAVAQERSEERRVGKECRSGWSTNQ